MTRRRRRGGLLWWTAWAAAVSFYGGVTSAQPRSGPRSSGRPRPAARPGARPAARPGARPAARPGARPAARPAARPGARPAARPSPARPAARPAAGCPGDFLKKVRDLNIRAAASYDDYDYEEAKATLQQAVALAEARGCAGKPELARSYLYLGIVYVVGYRDEEQGRKAWFKAFAIDPNITIPRRMETPRLMRSFAAAKQAYKAMAPRRAPGRPGQPAPRPKGPPKGLEHEPLTKVVGGRALEVSCRVGDELQAAKVVLYYRASFMGRYAAAPMTKKEKWTWAATVPATKVVGSNFKYFIVAYDGQGRPVAASGNAASPYVAEIVQEEKPVQLQEENPLAGARASRREYAQREEPGEVELPGHRRRAARVRRVATGQAPALFRVSVGTGLGIGLLNGTTEVARSGTDFDEFQSVPNTVSMGTLYGQFEVGYLLSDKLVVGVLARVGKTFISDVVYDQAEGNHLDWLILGRFRYESKVYGLGPAWLGWRWFAGGGLGYGYIRHHVRAKDVQVIQGQREDEVVDTDRAVGVVPNGFGGAELVFFRGYLTVFAEANYLMAFGANPDDNLYFHMDFTLGVASQF